MNLVNSDSAIDKDIVLPIADVQTNDNLDDDSLIKALLDHVERQDRQDDEPTEQIKPNLPKQRTFDEVALAGN